ncbi:hypothetical protein H4Q26_008040 [Puccinia striiformis f. sp. tritici PST-130]|nr:hypothetical protein H4Q26_008040 [Puccinia striiformis f. sp. tritici PST-130]
MAASEDIPTVGRMIWVVLRVASELALQTAWGSSFGDRLSRSNPFAGCLIPIILVLHCASQLQLVGVQLGVCVPPDSPKLSLGFHQPSHPPIVIIVAYGLMTIGLEVMPTMGTAKHEMVAQAGIER